MKGYRKPTGVYLEVADGTPVNSMLIEVALRPSPLHTFSDAWATAPLDPAVCWRIKTNAELDAESTTEGGARFEDMPKSMKAVLLLMRSYCNALRAGTYTNKTVADLKADYIAAYKVIP